MAQLPHLPRQLKSSQVLIRFGLRMAILVSFAAFAGIGFGKSLAALLWMSIILCAVETVAYAASFSLVSGFNHAALI